VPYGKKPLVKSPKYRLELQSGPRQTFPAQNQMGLMKEFNIPSGSALNILDQSLQFGFIEKDEDLKNDPKDGIIKTWYRLTGNGLYFLIQTCSIDYSDFTHYKTKILKIKGFNDENWQFVIKNHPELAFHLMKEDIEKQESEEIEDEYLEIADIELMQKEVDEDEEGKELYKKWKRGKKSSIPMQPSNAISLLFQDYLNSIKNMGVYDPQNELKQHVELYRELSQFIIKVLKELQPASEQFLELSLAGITDEYNKRAKWHQSLIKLLHDIPMFDDDSFIAP
jgi:hypothetical protein